MATLQRYVNRASAGGGDGTTNGTAGATAAYASLNSLRSNVTPTAADDLIATCCGSSADTTAVNFNYGTAPLSILIEGNTTSGDGYYTGDDAINTGFYRLTANTDAALLTLTNPRVTVRGIQLVHSSASGTFRSAITIATSGTVTVENCGIRSSVRSCVGTNGTALGIPDGTVWAFNNNLMVYTGAGTGCLEIRADTFRNPVWNVYQNTFYSTGSKPCISATGVGSNGTTVTNIKNNVCVNTTAPFTVTIGGTINYDSNVTDTGAFGTTNEINAGTLASFFTSPGTSDGSQFTLQASRDGATGLGITTDKRGTSRASPPDVGAYEFAAGGGGGTTYSDDYSESITADATLVNALTAVATVTETATLAETLAHVMTMPNALTESFTAGFALTDGNIFDDTLTETITVAQTFAVTMVHANTLTEAVALAEVFSALGIFVNSLTEAVSLADALVAGGGTSSIWTVVSPDGSTWTAVVPSGGTWTPAAQAGGSWTPQ